MVQAASEYKAQKCQGYCTPMYHTMCCSMWGLRSCPQQVLLSTFPRDRSSQAQPTLSVTLQRTSPRLGATMKEVKVEESPEHSLTGKLHHILVEAYRNPCKDNSLGNRFSLLIGESGSCRAENPRIQHSSRKAFQKKSKGLLGEGK